MTWRAGRPTEEDLIAAVQRAWGVTVLALRRHDSIYATSHRLEELEASLTDGRTVRLMFKHLGTKAMLPGAAAAKPAFLYDPRRPLAVYRFLLNRAGLGTAYCYGSWSDGDEHWLLLEKAPGVELYQVGELELWTDAARWLARAHAQFATARLAPELDELLLRYDAGFYRLWMDRALANARSGDARRQLKAIAERHDAVVERLMALPRTVVHGEYYASNVLVARDGTGVRVCPIDWEMAGSGPGLVDLAALSTAWARSDQQRLAHAYQQAAPVAPGHTFEQDLAACRLHLCLRWLGWSDAWQPPPEHKQDWLTEAMDLAEQLEAA